MRTHVPLPAPLTTGPFSVGAAAELGVSAGRLRGRDLARPFHGARLPSSVAASVQALCAAYAARSPPGHVFSHTTAAMLWGAPLPRRVEGDGALHVSAFKPAALPRAAGVAGHRVDAPTIEVCLRHGVKVTDPATTWLQLARLLGHDDVVAVGDHLVLVPARRDSGDPRPFVTLDALAERASVFHGHGAARVRRALADVRVGAESRRETQWRLIMRRARLPEPELNPELYSGSGEFLGRADMVFRAQRVIVEYDGEQHRTDDAQYERDLTRLERLREEGWHVIVVRKQHFAPRARALRLERISRALQRW